MTQEFILQFILAQTFGLIASMRALAKTPTINMPLRNAINALADDFVHALERLTRDLGGVDDA